MVAAAPTFARPLKAALVGVPALGAVLAAIAAAAGGFAVADRSRLLLIPACFAAVALAERFPVKIGPQQKINLGALPCLVAVLLLPPGLGPATAGLSVLAGNRFVRRSWTESAYNAGNVLAAAALASLVGALGTTEDLLRDVRATLGAFVYLAVNLGLAVVPPSFLTGRPYMSLLRWAASATWPASVTLAA